MPTAEYWVTDDHGSIFPTSSVTYSGQMTDNVVGFFDWTPNTLSDTGYHELTLYMADLPCASNLTFSDKIYVYIPGPVSVSSIPKSTDVQLYPNPNSGHFVLKATGLNKKKLAIVNTMGQVIEKDIQVVNEEVILPDNIPAGIYALKIYGEGSVQTISFVLARQ